MGIKTSITTSEGKKYKVFVGETERLKNYREELQNGKRVPATNIKPENY